MFCRDALFIVGVNITPTIREYHQLFSLVTFAILTSYS